MKQMSTCNKQDGFFAVGLGLALAAAFGVMAVGIETTVSDHDAAEQPAAKEAQVAYQDNEN